jgi:adenylate kinase
MASFIILLGPPGVGKGTQAKILAEKTHRAHISSGDLFRENIKNQTDLGKKAKAFLDKGELVPDDVTIDMIRDRLRQPDCQAGAILDGFPRTPAQAEALDTLLMDFRVQVDLVPYLMAPASVLVDRIGGRITCRAHSHIFHAKYNPPKVPGKCDLDGSELYQREDDKPATVQRRIQVYMEQTSPLIEYYRRQGKLIEVDGTLAATEVTAALMEAFQKSVKLS